MAGLLIQELKARGLIKRILIVAPANLTFQWQRELKDKFRQQFEVVRGAVLREHYGANPFQEKHLVITSVSWVSRIEDARDSLMRATWDLVIVDEAHKMSAYRSGREGKINKTLAYQLGEQLSERTDHYLLMTATPHKGDPDNFSLFLRLLDEDVYGDVSSLETAMAQQEAPFYLRRVKEALVTFPNPDTGEVKTLFTRRNVRTIDFKIDSEEWDFYDALTRFVECAHRSRNPLKLRSGRTPERRCTRRLCPRGDLSVYDTGRGLAIGALTASVKHRSTFFAQSRRRGARPSGGQPSVPDSSGIFRDRSRIEKSRQLAIAPTSSTKTA